ncbi:MAG: sulfurtransferase [Salinisphaeraceae bacterium]|nr:sulfurtransferase [Salinisphaeraceae bacterium]
MRMRLFTGVFATLTAATLMLSCVSQQAQAAKLPGPLVDPAWLKANLAGVTVVDVRSWPRGFTLSPEYQADKDGKKQLERPGGHIEGAKLLDYNLLRVDRNVQGKTIGKRVPEKAVFEKLMQDAGIPAGRPIVLTNPGDSFHEMDGAARVYWTLKYYGEDDVAILNGGNTAWLQAGYDVSTDAAKSGAGDWQATAERRELIAEVDDVEAAMKQGAALVDARSVEQYLGVSRKSSVQAAGHLKGARNFPIDVHTRSEGLAALFMTPDEYGDVFRKLEIDAGPGSIAYCNTGHLAAGAWFVLSEILGVKNARLYDGSMLEWTTLGRPVVGLAD